MLPEIKLSQDLLSKLFYEGPAVIFVWANDPDWSVEFVSPNIQEMLGYLPQEFYDKKILYAHIVHPDDLPRVIEEVKSNAFEKKADRWVHEPYRLIGKNNQVVWVRDYTFVIRNQNQNIINFVGYIIDITQQEESKRYLEDELNKFYNFFINNPAVMLLINPSDGKIIKANQRAIEFYGYTQEEFEKLYIHQINSLSVEEIKEKMRLAKEKHQSFFQCPHRLANGKIKEVEVYSAPIEFQNNKYLLSVIIDITEKLKIQNQFEQINMKLEELLQNEIHYRAQLFKKYNLIFEQSFFGIGILEDFRLIDANSRLESFFSPIPLREIQKENFFDFFYFIDNVFFKNGMPANFQKQSYVFEVQLKNDPKKYFFLFIQPFEDRSDNKDKQIVILFDISEKKKIENEKKDFEKMLIHQSKIVAIGESLSALAHQWRQPLNSIGLMIQYLDQLSKEDLYFKDPKERKILQETTKDILEQLSFLTHTIDDFREFFRHETEETSFFVKEEIQKVISLLKVQLENHNIQIHLNDEDSNFEVKGYPNLFKHVILNIVNNSKDAILDLKKKQSNYKRNIVIRIIPEKKAIHICDNGGGVPDEFVDFLFQPYFSTKKFEGSGLGLYITNLILKKMKANIKYYHNIDNNEVIGACFQIHF